MNSEIITQYFPDINPTQKEQFQKLEGLYRDWNAKINVISRKDIDDLYLKHVLHSLGLAKIIYFQDGVNVLDVGTGGGFPGIPLAILFPKVQFHLVDSIGKKITVVKEVAASLGLENVVAEKARAEDLPQQYNYIVSRAVTRMSAFNEWVKDKIKEGIPNKETLHSEKSQLQALPYFQNGIFYLKGGDLKEELTEAKVKYKLFKLSDYFKEEFFETKMVVYLPR